MEPALQIALARELSELYFGPRLEEALQKLSRLAPLGAGLILWGESGTGKNLFAYLAHRLGQHPDGPFVEISCSALPESLVEAELFGYTRGAFTGAVEDHPGRLLLAQGGTLVLDELDSLPPSSQAKLLRVVESGRYSPMGSTATIFLNARFIAITQEEPSVLMARGRLRTDLYYRLAAFTLELPPLRQWAAEIPALLNFLLQREAGRLRVAPVTLSAGVLTELARYSFPGNLRQVLNLLRQWLLLRPAETIEVIHLPPGLQPGRRPEGEFATLREMEEAHIRQALRKTGGHQGEAARLLGIHRKTLWEKRRAFGIGS